MSRVPWSWEGNTQEKGDPEEHIIGSMQVQ